MGWSHTRGRIVEHLFRFDRSEELMVSLFLSSPFPRLPARPVRPTCDLSATPMSALSSRGHVHSRPHGCCLESLPDSLEDGTSRLMRRIDCSPTAGTPQCYNVRGHCAHPQSGLSC